MNEPTLDKGNAMPPKSNSQHHMKSIILFSRFQKPRDKPVRNSPFHASLLGIPGLIIRAEVVDQVDVDEALNKANGRLRDGETVLNTIPFPLEVTVYCPTCHQPIDPEVCSCGDYIKNHSYGHSPVPIGCRCGTTELGENDEQSTTKNEHENEKQAEHTHQRSPIRSAGLSDSADDHASALDH